MEEIQEHDIVIVGGGIAGFTTCLGLHRYCFFLYLIFFSVKGSNSVKKKLLNKMLYL